MIDSRQGPGHAMRWARRSLWRVGRRGLLLPAAGGATASIGARF